MNRFPVLWTLALAAVLASGCQEPPAPAPKVIQRDLLHTIVELRLFGNPDDNVYESIFGRLADIGDRMTDYQASSEVSRVSAQAGIAPVKVSPDTLKVVQRGLAEAALTGGIFDPTIGPVTHLWHIGDQDPEHPVLPSPAAVKTALSLVNWKDVAVDEAASTVYLKKKGMVLDFGGVIKGYALDEALRLGREAGVASGIFNMGNSSMALVGKKPGGKPWKIGVQDPFQAGGEGGYFAMVEGSDLIVETSGPYQKFITFEGRRYHHIMDPRTGAPADSGLEQVTLLLPLDSQLSDGLSTSCFILGLEKGLALVESLPGAAAIFVTSDRQVHLSSRVGSRFKLKDPNDKSFTVVAGS